MTKNDAHDMVFMKNKILSNGDKWNMTKQRQERNEEKPKPTASNLHRAFLSVPDRADILLLKG